MNKQVLEIDDEQVLEPREVTFQVTYKVHDPAKLISEWLRRCPSAKDMLIHEPEWSINWASCILDILTEEFDDESIGVEMYESTCYRNDGSNGEDD